MARRLRRDFASGLIRQSNRAAPGYFDHLRDRGVDLFRATCERDLEGLVAKRAKGAYRTDGRVTSWLKIKNPPVLADGGAARAV